MTIKESMKPLVFALADAIETDLATGAQGRRCFAGSRKAVLDLFEGYSPTIISGVDDSLYDPGNSVVAVDQHIFGNVGAITVVEGRQSTVHCFVYDRSKRPDNSNCSPWDNFWSRKRLYYWLGHSCKAIYHRSIFDTEWQELPSGRAKLQKYNDMRDKDAYSSTKAYNAMWEDLK